MLNAVFYSNNSVDKIALAMLIIDGLFSTSTQIHVAQKTPTKAAINSGDDDNNNNNIVVAVSNNNNRGAATPFGFLLLDGSL